MDIRLIDEKYELWADIADSLRKVAGRPRLKFDRVAATVTIPDDETTPPAAEAAVQVPATPAAASLLQSQKFKAAPAKPAAKRPK